jgi:hypothetical protein
MGGSDELVSERPQSLIDVLQRALYKRLSICAPPPFRLRMESVYLDNVAASALGIEQSPHAVDDRDTGDRGNTPPVATSSACEVNGLGRELCESGSWPRNARTRFPTGAVDPGYEGSAHDYIAGAASTALSAAQSNRRQLQRPSEPGNRRHHSLRCDSSAGMATAVLGVLDAPTITNHRSAECFGLVGAAYGGPQEAANGLGSGYVFMPHAAYWLRVFLRSYSGTAAKLGVLGGVGIFAPVLGPGVGAWHGF